MKAVVWHDVGKVSVDDVPNPAVKDRSDAIVRITTSAICGTDPTTVWTQQETIPTALQAYEAFDRCEPGWTKVTLEVG